MADAVVARPCPSCGGLRPALLRIASQRKPLDYFLCKSCMHTWAVPKSRAVPQAAAAPPDAPEPKRGDVLRA